MIGTLPMRALAPLDYRYALDAAMPHLAQRQTLLHCAVPVLAAEARQRLVFQEALRPEAGLWVEPLVDAWRRDIASFATSLPAGAPLVVIASQPGACLVPERRGWPGRPVGFAPMGIGQLRWALHKAGFTVEARYGVHTAAAIVLSILGQCFVRLHQPALGDQLHFAARLHYSMDGPLAALATVALFFARKGSN